MPLSRTRRRLIYILAPVAVLAIVLLVFGSRIQSSVRSAAAEYVRELVSTSAWNSTDGKLQVDIADVSYNVFTGDVDVTGIRASVRRDSLSAADVTIDITAVHARGLYVWNMLFGSGLSLGSIDVDDPHVTMLQAVAIPYRSTAPTETPLAPDTSLVRLPRIPDANALLNRLLAAVLPEKVKPLNIGRISVHRGRFESREGDMHGVDIEFSKISVGADEGARKLVQDASIRIASWDRAFDADKHARIRGFAARVNAADTTLAVDTVLYHRSASMNIYGSGIALSTRERRLQIDSFDIRPPVSDDEYFAQSKYKQDRTILYGRTVGLRGIDVGALMKGEALRVENIGVKNFTFDIRCDYTRPVRKATTPPAMPYQLLRSIPFKMQVDSLNFRHATIQYTEKKPHWTKDAILEWSDMKVLVRDLSNDSMWQAAGHPLRINASGRFMHATEMEASIVMPMHLGRHVIDAEGRMGAMPLALLGSKYLAISESTNITSGALKSAAFRMHVSGRKATGMVLPEYTGLNLAMIDSKTHKKGLWGGITSFLANWLVIKNDNVRGEDFREGKIDYMLPKDAAIFQTLWFPVRKGLSVSVGF